ncbi:MAG: hypothetical protein Tsb0013_17010 [Phycisphaerales bacterium]
MPFLNGQVSFTRLAITTPSGGAGPSLIGEAQLDALREHILVPGEIGVKGELETGWCAGAHVYDEHFTADHCTFAGGSVLHCAMRTDTNRVPGEIKRAIKGQLEAAAKADADAGVLSRAEKRDLRDMLESSLHKELASGRHRSSAMTPLLWDAERQTLLFATSANKATEALMDLWRRTFDGQLQLTTLSAGRLAYDHLAKAGRTRDLEDLQASPFTNPPPHVGDTHARTPDVPWSMGGPEPHDFLGNEFLIWLWRRWEDEGARIDVTLPSGGQTTLEFALDRLVEMQCAWGVTGKQSLRGDAEGPSPLRMPEAADALASGKWPRKVGLLLADDEGSSWRCTLQADRWAITGVALPDPPEDMEDEREKLEWRIDRTRALDERLLGLFHAFLDVRASDAWPTERQRLTDWIRARKPGSKPGVQVEPTPSHDLQSV